MGRDYSIIRDAGQDPVTGYSDLLGEVDRLAARLSEHYKGHLVCRAGCVGCCQCNISIFEVEAAAVKTALHSVGPASRRSILHQARKVREREARGEPVSCPLLLDNRCAIYAARPVICRTQGLPLLYQLEDGTHEVDFCPLNFTDPGATEELEENHLVPLDRLNERLALVNIAYCRSQGRQISESGTRTKMSDLVLDQNNRVKKGRASSQVGPGFSPDT